MALTINTNYLKNLSNVTIECQLAQQIGLQVFNNLGTNTPEYAELCAALKESCEKIATDIKLLEAAIPVF